MIEKHIYLCIYCLLYFEEFLLSEHLKKNFFVQSNAILTLMINSISGTSPLEVPFSC